jgi:chromosome segregation ATPase
MSNQQSGDNESLLRHIASTVRDILDRMVTKEEFEPVREQVTHLTGQVTHLTGQVTHLTGQANHLTEQVGFLGGQVEEIRDRMATKEDLARVGARLEHKIEVEVTAARGDIEQVHLRLDSIDKALSSRIGHVESEMSRMRSVLYLLVKDRPDMLRLLGQAPPAGG